MRLERLAPKRLGVRLLVAVACVLTVDQAFAYAPDVEAPAEERETGDSAISIAPTNDSQKGSLPDNMPSKAGGQPDDPDTDDGAEMGDDADQHGPASEATAVPEPAASIKDVVWGLDDLPAPVRATRDTLLNAAKTGKIDALRPIFEQWDAPPIVSAFDAVPDPVDHLRRQSGDEEGREILAILVELLESGHIHLGDPSAGTYVWPYFAEVPLEELKDSHYVELYRILTAIDVEEIMRQGRYTFFRVGISADGRLRYFTAGALE